MSKTKIYELAKELNVENKKLVEMAQKLGIKATSHLSGIEDSDVEKIKNNISKNTSSEKEAKKQTIQSPSSKDKKVEAKKINSSKNNKKKSSSNKSNEVMNEKSKEEQKGEQVKKTESINVKKESKDSSKKEEIKTTGHVIIRREVIVEEEKKNSKPVRENKNGIGFTERRNKDFNIVYREKPVKPMTVNELFGIKPKIAPKKEEPIASNEEPKQIAEKELKSVDQNQKTLDDKKVIIKEESAKNENQEENKQSNDRNNKNDFQRNNTVNRNNRTENGFNNKDMNGYNRDNRNNRESGSYNRDNRNYRDSKDSATYNRDSGNPNREYRNNNYNNRNNNFNNNRSNFGRDNSNNRDNNFGRNNYNNNRSNFGRDNYNNRDNNSFQRNVQNNQDRGYSRQNDNDSSNTFRHNDRFGNRNPNSNFNRSNNSGFNNHVGNGTNFANRGNGTFQRNNNNGFKKDFRKPGMGHSTIDKDIKDIVSVDFGEKDNQRDYSTKIIDKQKANRNFDDKKKTSKSRRNDGEENFDEDKLRNLKQVDKLSNMFEDQEGGMLDYYDLTTERGKKNKRKIKRNEDRNKQKIFELKSILIPETISVKDLAAELKKTSTEVIKKLFDLGIMASINQSLDFDTAYLVADGFGVYATKKEVVKDEDILFDDTDDKEQDLQDRPPVVVVMGHVDHGKTSLLDAIRKTNVIEGEAGGITQHIGAYKVNVNGREITFLDTPGHEAFTSMRARGAQITDIAILVVAADDGVMPQTIEAINHAKSAGIPIIVAVNKIDLPGANVEKVKQELMKYELVPEEWGGDTIFVPISAKNNINIDNLLEMVLLVADMQNLKADPNRQSKGTVIEARLDKAQGPIASVLVQRGTLNVGDTIILGSSIGKIRTMKNDKGKNVKEAGPSTPVEITGLHDVPEAGDTFYEVKNEKVAKHLIEQRKLENREKAIENTDTVTLDNLFEKMESEELKQLSIILKTDVQGTAEALKTSLEKLSNDEVRVKVIHSNAGGVTESDVELAKAAHAIIIAFNVRPVGATKKLAEKEGVEIKQYSIIYQALEDVEDAMKGMLAPVYKEVNIGNAEVRQTFKISNVGTIAGCFVLDGKLARNAGVRVIRDSVVIHEGKLISLKRFKDDAKEVSKGFECGLQIESFDDLKEGDTIEAFINEEVKR